MTDQEAEKLKNIIKNADAFWRRDGLELRELIKICDDVELGMCTTNGDTSPIELTARQVVMLMAGYIKRCQRNSDDYMSPELSKDIQKYQLF